MLCPNHSRAKWNRIDQRSVILWIEYVPLRSGEDGTVPQDIAGSALMTSARGRSCQAVRNGDSLFPGGVGKTTSPDNFASLINDVEDRLFAVLPDDTWFYPGHGDDSTLGKERPSLAEWRARGW